MTCLYIRVDLLEAGIITSGGLSCWSWSSPWNCLCDCCVWAICMHSVPGSYSDSQPRLGYGCISLGPSLQHVTSVICFRERRSLWTPRGHYANLIGCRKFEWRVTELSRLGSADLNSDAARVPGTTTVVCIFYEKQSGLWHARAQL
jgi:hypothetical protein